MKKKSEKSFLIIVEKTEEIEIKIEDDAELEEAMLSYKEEISEEIKIGDDEEFENELLTIKL